MAIADDLSALSKHILLIAFVIHPVLISWLDLQLGFPLACPLHSKDGCQNGNVIWSLSIKWPPSCFFSPKIAVYFRMIYVKLIHLQANILLDGMLDDTFFIQRQYS